MKAAREPEQVQALKNEMLAQALDIVTDEGFDKLTMRSLASRMQMTAPNLYNYFSSKEEIYITLMLRGFEQLTAAVESRLSACASPVERARALMRTYVEFGIENERLYGLMFSADTPKYQEFTGTEHEALSTREHDLSMRLLGVSTEVVRELGAARGHHLSKDEAKTLVAAGWSLVHGIVSLANSHNLAYVVPEPLALLDAVAQQWLDGVA